MQTCLCERISRMQREMHRMIQVRDAYKHTDKRWFDLSKEHVCLSGWNDLLESTHTTCIDDLSSSTTQRGATSKVFKLSSYFHVSSVRWWFCAWADLTTLHPLNCCKTEGVHIENHFNKSSEEKHLRLLRQDTLTSVTSSRRRAELYLTPELHHSPTGHSSALHYCRSLKATAHAVRWWCGLSDAFFLQDFQQATFLCGAVTEGLPLWFLS